MISYANMKIKKIGQSSLPLRDSIGYKGVVTMLPDIWAHRGASHKEPENTMAAFRQAVADGADGIELDVQRTADGRIVVCHDEDLKRLAGVQQFLPTLTWAQLQEVNIAAHKPDAGVHRIPLLTEVLDFVVENQIKLNIELKNSIFLSAGMEEQVLDLVRQAKAESLCCYSSFNHDSMLKMSTLVGPEKCGLLYFDILHAPVPYAQSCQAGALHPALNSLLVPGYVAAAHAAQIKVHVWTVDEDLHLQFALLNDVDAIITNEPARALALRAQYAQDQGAAFRQNLQALQVFIK